MKISTVKQNILLFGFLVIALFNSGGFAQDNCPDLISIENKTASLTIVTVENKGLIPELKERGFGDFSLYDISLRNDYDKPIAVYKLEGWDEFRGEKTNEPARGTFLTKWTFKPGQVMNANFVSSAGGKARLMVEAVIFEDGSGDGDAATVASLQEQRNGVGLAYKKLIPILQDVLKMPLTTSEQILQLREKIDNVYPEKGASKNIAEGFGAAKFYLRSACYRLELLESGEAGKAPNVLIEWLKEMETSLKNFSEPPKTARLRFQ